MHRGAILAYPDASGEPLCRFMLERGEGGPTAAWLMWNPSRASHLVDDPTTGRVVGHSANAGCPRSLIANVFALRTPYPADLDGMLQRGDYTEQMHAENMESLAAIAGQSDVLVVAFGAAARRYARWVDMALDAFNPSGLPLLCLGTTADNLPLHPLARGRHAIRADTKLRPWLR